MIRPFPNDPEFPMPPPRSANVIHYDIRPEKSPDAGCQTFTSEDLTITSANSATSLRVKNTLVRTNRRFGMTEAPQSSCPTFPDIMLAVSFPPVIKYKKTGWEVYVYMKKWAVFIALILTVLCLTGCRKNDNSSGSSSDEKTSTTTITSTTTTTTTTTDSTSDKPNPTVDGFKKIGEIVTFGSYPQTTEGTDRTPIEWIVLDYDEAGHKALLLSKYGLEAKPYNAEWVDSTWETCSLRAWLNSDFLNAAFSTDEQSAILTTEVDNSAGQGYSGWSTDGGNNTQDKVFLLSCAEASRYLAAKHYSEDDGTNIKSRVAPTKYAIQTGANRGDSYGTSYDDLAGWWWLRSPGNRPKYAALIYYEGSINCSQIIYDNGIVRPAFWLNLDSGII